MSLVFIMCTEPGPLEAESQLLARSIRHFGGRWKSSRIISYQPRATADLNRSTLRSFELLEVEHRRILLNTAFKHYPVANKALSAAHAEQELSSCTLVMLDSDKAVLNEPNLLDLADDRPMAMRPVHQKLSGTTGMDGNLEQWQALYRHLGLKPRFKVETTMHGESIWGYWNSGLVAARPNAGLFSKWRDHLATILSKNLLQDRHAYFADQFALAAAVDSVDRPVNILPPTYNYPIAFHSAVHPERAVRSWTELVTIHYHKMFYGVGASHPLRLLSVGPADDPRRQWLIDELHRTGVYRQGFRADLQRWSRRSEKKLNAYRRRLAKSLGIN